MHFYEVLVVGAGAAGMMAAQEAAKRGRKVALIDHSPKIGMKILISGGGRCNFTNTGAAPNDFVSNNPHFCKSALSRYTPQDFIALVERHGVAYHEKKLGQLFCDTSAKEIVRILVEECKSAGVAFHVDTAIQSVQKKEDGFFLETNRGSFKGGSLVIATGGLSIPKIGATGFGYEVAEQFGLKMVATAPALDGFTWDTQTGNRLAEISGVSVDSILTVNGVSFRENILFTHVGLSGPAALQASLYWNPGDAISINLLPDTDLSEWLLEQKQEGAKAELKNALTRFFPKSFTEKFCKLSGIREIPLLQLADKELKEFAAKVHDWKIIPAGTVGYQKAEVTRGGVDTDEISSKTMESKKVPGLYFIGEVVDVTGRLGGYNFQWAWSSGWVAGQYA